MIRRHIKWTLKPLKIQHTPETRLLLNYWADNIFSSAAWLERVCLDCHHTCHKIFMPKLADTLENRNSHKRSFVGVFFKMPLGVNGMNLCYGINSLFVVISFRKYNRL